jgi:hypothetical protein
VTTFTQPMGDFESTLPDAGLGPEVEIDHDRVPLGVSFVFGPTYDGTVFATKDNLLYYSKPKQPEYFPSLFYIEVSTPQFPLMTGLIHGGQVYCLSKRDIFYIQGTGDGTFLPFKRDCRTGAQTVLGAITIPGKGICHTGPDGIYMFNASSDVKISEQSLEPLFRGEDVEDMAAVDTMADSWLWNYKNLLYFGYRSSGQDAPGNILVLNLDTGKVAYYVYNDGADVQIRTITTDDTNSRLLIGDNTGYIRVIESPSYTDDSGVAIPFDVKSKDFLLSTRSHFPRHVWYDVEASNAESVTGELYLDGEVHQTHTITGSRVIRRRLVDTGNGSRAAVRIHGSGPAAIFVTEFE